MKKYYQVTTYLVIPAKIDTEFEDDKQAKTWVQMFCENPKYRKDGSVPVVPYTIEEVVDYVPQRLWASHDDLLPGVKAGKWYVIDTKTDNQGYDVVTYSEDPSAEGGDADD